MSARMWWLPVLALAGVGAYVSLAPVDAPRPPPAPAPVAVAPPSAPPSALPSVDGRAVRRAIALKAPDERVGRPRVRRPAAMAPEDIHHASSGVAPMVYQCYQQRVEAGAKPAGKLTVRFTLVKQGGYGQLQGLSVADGGVADPALMKCIQGAAVEAFPVMGDDGEIELSVPFTLPPPEDVEGSAP